MPLCAIDDCWREVAMSCGYCGSIKETELATEINFHIPGPLSSADPGIFVFPKVSVCLDCGCVHFILRRDEMQVIEQRLVEKNKNKRLNCSGVF